VQLDGRFRFDNFIVGSANRLAVAAARAVAETPGHVYNPLFIYSGSGLGKTHLLGAIGHQVRQIHGEMLVEYVSLEDFVEQLHAAISAGQTEAFKTRYARLHVLLVDDVQFLTGRRETQSELLRLFNVMHADGGQIILASDRPPSEIADVDERLITRLAGGLIVDMGVPDLETRVAILRSKCEERGVQFDPEVLEELALLVAANVRELQGALNRLIAHQSLGDAPLRAEDVPGIFGIAARPRAGTPAGGSSGEFLNFVSGIATAVAETMEPWKVRLGEAMAYWSGEGYRTAVLERALSQVKAPDVEGLLKHYAAAIERLRTLESEATAIDAVLGGSELFRDPERVGEAELLVEQARTGQMPPPGPSPVFTREAFEVSPSNQMAVRAADAVVQDPGRKYNPLFVHGPSGVGKTHLANAIGNDLVEATGGVARVSVVGAQTFIDELIAALQEGTIERWRNRYRAADVLILDDVQFVAQKERTQDELFHVFNALHDAGKQIILTSDAPPKELEGLEERLRSRFEGGLVVAIQAPDRALRERLYLRQLASIDPAPDPALLEYLAERPVSSVREILGTVHRLVAAAEVAGVALSLELARTELAVAGAAPAPVPTTVQSPVDTFFLDDEKVVWDWPEVTGRVIEELR
jgi:chromosomal replication initiator protein DnaA